MDGGARLRVERGPGHHCRVRDLEEAPPVAIRRCGDTFYLVATAAGPIGTDRVSVRVEVGPGATAVVRTVGATIAYGGVDARLDVVAVVEEDATLHWLPGPLIATGPCSLGARSILAMAGTATVVWREEVVLGRHGEEPGRLRQRFRADLDGRPLLRHDLDLGPGAAGWDGPAVLGGHRAVGFHLVAGDGRPLVAGDGRPAGAPAEQTPAVGDGWATLDLTGPGRLTMAVAADLATLRRRLGPERPAP
ncbi:MAG TPA: urease accessory protein UreD [Acidimicrobiales bacterium]|nr:urease accessory protein UreD [Acidimicrobiales bacterium]